MRTEKQFISAGLLTTSPASTGLVSARPPPFGKSLGVILEVPLASWCRRHRGQKAFTLPSPTHPPTHSPIHVAVGIAEVLNGLYDLTRTRTTGLVFECGLFVSSGGRTHTTAESTSFDDPNFMTSYNQKWPIVFQRPNYHGACDAVGSVAME